MLVCVVESLRVLGDEQASTLAFGAHAHEDLFGIFASLGHHSCCSRRSRRSAFPLPAVAAPVAIGPLAIRAGRLTSPPRPGRQALGSGASVAGLLRQNRVSSQRGR